jgi:hypothetical protein
LLLAALAKYGLGEASAASALVVAADEARKSDRLGGLLRTADRRQQEAIFHTLRGLYLVKLGRNAEAQRDFEIAATNPIDNVYVERARMMLEATTSKEDGPSSLAPQVMANPE